MFCLGASAAALLTHCALSGLVLPAVGQHYPQRPQTLVLLSALAQQLLLCFHTVHLQGLSYLHSVNITHGDLKPGNVLLKSSRLDRRGFTVRLADFGFCRIGGEGQGGSRAKGRRGRTRSRSEMGQGEAGKWVKGKRGRAGRAGMGKRSGCSEQRFTLAFAGLAARAKVGGGSRGTGEVQVKVGDGSRGSGEGLSGGRRQTQRLV